MKRVLATAMACLLAGSVLFSGCQSSGTASGGGTDSGEQIELRFSWWGSDNRHEAIQKAVKLYEDEHPNVKITVEYGAWTGWTESILTQLGGKTEADIVQVNYNWVHSFGKGKNVFLDLNTMSEYLDLSNWDEAQLAAMQVDGEQAAVPHGMTARAHLYSKPLFEEAGLEYPKTYQEMMDAAKIIGAENSATGAENKYVFMNIGKECPDLYIAQMLFNKTGKVMQVDGQVQYSEQEVKEVLEQYREFEMSGAMPTFEQQDPLDNESNPVWTSGRGGSIYEWIGTMDKYLSSYKGGEAKDEIAVAPYILEAEGANPSIYVKPSLGYAISKNCKNPEVAADFLEFFFTNEQAVTELGTSIGISSNAKARQIQEDAGLLTGVMKEGFDMLDQYEQVVLDPYFEDANIRGERFTVIEAYRSGKISSDEAAKQYIEKQQAELDKLFK